MKLGELPENDPPVEFMSTSAAGQGGAIE